MERFPKISRSIMADFLEINDVTVFLCAVTDHPGIALIRACEIDAEEQSALDTKVSVAYGLMGCHVVIQQRRVSMQRLKRLVRHRGLAAYKPDLVQRLPSADFDGERAWDDLQEKPASIAGTDFVESGGEIRHHAGEDIQTARRALGIRPRTDRLREGELFQQRNEIHVTLLQNRSVGQIHLVHHKIRLIKIQYVQS